MIWNIITSYFAHSIIPCLSGLKGHKYFVLENVPIYLRKKIAKITTNYTNFATTHHVANYE